MAVAEVLAAGFTGLTGLGGTLLALALALPVAALLLGLVLSGLGGGRHLGRFVLALLVGGLGLAVLIAAAVFTGGAPLRYELGGWPPPLGVALKADGPAAAMLLTAAVVLVCVGVFAQRGFALPAGVPEARRPLVFWTLLTGIWGGLTAVFLGQDLFSLFVALELLTFSAVPLVSLDGKAETLAAALRYLLFALLGSVCYLLGAVLLYGVFGVLDIGLLAQWLAGPAPSPAVVAALALMTAGLLAKTALFPLYLWLPPAHAGAPPAGSAVLSALVVKGSFFVLFRLWFDLMPGFLSLPAAQYLGIMGAGAILFGNLMALRQARLKLLIAYSTVAQIGYLFLGFPLAAGAGGAVSSAALIQVTAHACAKGAMFLAAGLMAAALGHDRIRDLGGAGRTLPLTLLAFALAGFSLIGLQPSGGYLVKTLLGTAAGATGQWWWGLVMDVGGLLTAAYLVWVLVHALPGERRAPPAEAQPGLAAQLAVLGLALCALLLGLLPLGAFDLLQVGRPGVLADTGALAAALADPWAADKLLKGLVPVLVVAVLVLVLKARSGAPGGLPAPLRSLGRWPGQALAWTDQTLRGWPMAGTLLPLLILLLAVGLLPAA
jgi:multicomponent Na+:H+ antiporter subunit D